MRKPSSHILVGALVLLLGGFATGVEAALNSYLTLTGETQGEIKGEVTRAGREDTIEIFEYHHLVTLPTSGGQIVGPPAHEPLIFTTKLGRSTPNLFRALSTGERVDGIIHFWRPSSTGGEVQYFTVELGNARVVAVEPIKASTLDPNTASLPDMQRIRIIYQTLTVTYEPDGNSYLMNLQGGAAN